MSVSSVTVLLRQLQNGDTTAADAIMPLIYDELRSLAASMIKRERPGHTLQPTALLHEAYLKLVDQRKADYRSEAHFMAVAAMVMRRTLVNHAQARAAEKRGGAAQRVKFSDSMAAPIDEGDIDVLALDEALNRLASRDPRKAAVVEQRYFAGVQLSQIAENLGVSLATVKRDWEFARTWLAREISGHE